MTPCCFAVTVALCRLVSFDKLLHAQVVTKLVTKLDLSESDVSNTALTVISTSCPSLQTIDLNAGKINRTAISSQGLHCLLGKID